MPILTGKDFIGCCLPDLPVPNIDYYKEGDKKRKRSATAKVLPPRTLKGFDPEVLKHLLTLPEVASRLRATYTVLDVANTHQIEVEADVERAMHLYLVHNINLIVQELPSARSKLSCLSQVVTGLSRTDLVWKIGTTSVLILEAKRSNVLRESDWIPAVVTSTRTAAAILQEIRTDRSNSKTALQENAVVLSQQAKKYANICPVVVLFDWKSMVLLDFNPNGAECNDEINSVQYMFTNGRSTQSADGTIWTHRKFLLAAFLHGMRKQGLL